MGSLVCLLGQVHAGAEPRGWLDVLRHDVAPVASAYLVFVIMLAAHARSRRRPRLESEHRRTVRWRRTPDPPDPGWRELFAYVLGTAIG
ncbi:MAG TPA: hypothetical protein VF972_01205, partial [Actinomycetota bacterium]